MSQGTVKWFNAARGYGFITEKQSQKDHFVHFSDIEGTGYKSLEEGDEVEFIAEKRPKGLQAIKVRKC